jgi:hypothetical protein
VRVQVVARGLGSADRYILQSPPPPCPLSMPPPPCGYVEKVVRSSPPFLAAVARALVTRPPSSARPPSSDSTANSPMAHDCSKCHCPWTLNLRSHSITTWTPSGASCFPSPSPYSVEMPTFLPVATRDAHATSRRTSTPCASLAQSRRASHTYIITNKSSNRHKHIVRSIVTTGALVGPNRR